MSAMSRQLLIYPTLAASTSYTSHTASSNRSSPARDSICISIERIFRVACENLDSTLALYTLDTRPRRSRHLCLPKFPAGTFASYLAHQVAHAEGDLITRASNPLPYPRGSRTRGLDHVRHEREASPFIRATESYRRKITMQVRRSACYKSSTLTDLYKV